MERDQRAHQVDFKDAFAINQCRVGVNVFNGVNLYQARGDSCEGRSPCTPLVIDSYSPA